MGFTTKTFYPKLLRLLFICLFTFFAQAQTSKPDGECRFVNAPSGLNLRAEPRLDARVIRKLNHGESVYVTERSDRLDTILDGDNRLIGSWATVTTLHPHQKHNYAYVFDRFLTKELEDFPARALRFLNYLEFQILDSDDPGVSEIINGTCCNRLFFQNYYCGQPFLDHNESSHSQAPGSEFSPEEIYERVQLSIVPKHKLPVAIPNNYAIDTTFKPDPKPLYDDERSDGRHLRQFDLPLDNGETLNIKDTDGEYEVSHTYTGYIPATNQYVTTFHFESEEHTIWNKSDGSPASNSNPIISPDGGLAIYLDHFFYEDGGQVFINFLNSEYEVTSSLHLNFKSWFPSSDPFDAYWIDDQTVVFKSYPITANGSRTDIAFYIKMRIE